MGKRRKAAVEDDDEDWGAGSRALAASKPQNGDVSARENTCRAHLRALNEQFAECVPDRRVDPPSNHP